MCRPSKFPCIVQSGSRPARLCGALTVDSFAFTVNWLSLTVDLIAFLWPSVQPIIHEFITGPYHRSFTATSWKRSSDVQMRTRNTCTATCLQPCNSECQCWLSDSDCALPMAVRACTSTRSTCMYGGKMREWPFIFKLVPSWTQPGWSEVRVARRSSLTK